MTHYDAIIIGGGNGGLVAAATLAKGGKKVALFEKNTCVGGVAVSFRRGRFDFEVSLHELCGFGRHDTPYGSVRQIFDHLGISDKIDWVDIPEAYRMITYDSDRPIDAVMPFGIDNYVRAMEKYVPGSLNETKALFDLAQEYLAVTGKLGSAKSKKDAIKMLLRHKDFLHTCSLSLDDGLNSFDLPEKAKDIFKGYWAYLCADSGDLTFFHYLCMVNSYIELKSAIPRNRSLEMSTVIANCAEKYGADIFLNTQITGITVKDGKTRGVVSKNGNRFSCDDVICDISPLTVYSSMIDKQYVPISDIKKTNARELSGRGFCVFLGLNKSAQELGLKEYSYFIYPDMNTKKQIGNMVHPDTNGVQNTVCPNAADPTASPEGTCILVMTTLFTSDYWDNIEKKDYFSLKNRFAEKMIETFEKATGVSLKPYIEEIEIATPATFARYMNSPGGAIYGYRAAFWDGMFARKMMDKAYSDIKGLEFVGGYGFNLNGYSSAFGTGFDKAKYILRRDGLME